MIREAVKTALKLISIPLLFLGGLAVLATPAWAYVDPNAGSVLLQVLLGGIAGLAVFGKLFWKKIKSFFDR